MSRLSIQELRRRIAAACALKSWSQDDLNKGLHEYGLNKNDGKGIISGRVQLTPANLHALSVVLDLPEEWFIEPNLDNVLNVQSADAGKKVRSPDLEIANHIQREAKEPKQVRRRVSEG